MLRFRTFRNEDPPALMAIWNEAARGRGAAPMPSPLILERSIFSKPYFDPAGLIVAEDDELPVGFAHAAFGPNDEETACDPTRGVVCAVLVRSSHHRRGIGDQLLQRAERYLYQRGTRTAMAGCHRPLNPFYFGLYGGCDVCGLLGSDTTAEPFFAKHGYEPGALTHVFARRLAAKLPANHNGNFADLRQRFEVQFYPVARVNSWWQECVLGLVEPAEFRLTERRTGQTAARAVVWEMEGFEPKWNCPVAGIIEIFVRSEFRRRGLARFLVVQLMRAIQEQEFGIIEVQCPEHNLAGQALFRGLGFEQVDHGRFYRKELATADPT